MHFAIGYPCVSDFFLSFCYPGSVGQVCPELGQVICNVDYRQWNLTLMLLVSGVRSNIVGLRLLTWLLLLMWWGPFRAEIAACLNHPRALDSLLTNFTSRDRGGGGCSLSSAGLTVPTRWATAISSSSRGGSTFILELQRARTFSSTEPGPDSGRPKILTKSQN